MAPPDVPGLARALLGRARRLTRRPIVAVLVAAVLLRVVVAVVVNEYLDGSLIFDDDTYSRMAAEKADGSDRSWDPFTESLYRSTATFLVPLTVLYRAFGPVQLVGQLLVAAVGTVTVALTWLLAREVVDRRWAAVAAAVVALLPSQVAFSASTLKDAFVWALLAGLSLVVVRAARAREARRLVAYGAAAVAFLVLLAHLRNYVFLCAVFALALTAWVGVGNLRVARTAGGLGMLLLVPWTLGYGPAGIDGVPSHASVASYREGQSTGGSAVSTPTTTATGSIGSGGGDSAVRANLRHLPRGVSVVLVEPYPWDPAYNARTRFARLEMLAWYPLLAFALAGLVALARRRALGSLAFPIVVGAGLVVAGALTEGNVGTAFRHRGQVVWIVAVLAAAAGSHLVASRASGRRDQPEVLPSRSS